MQESIVFPLINFEDGCSTSTAKFFLAELEKEVERAKKKSIDGFNPYYVILKTRNGKSFGVVVSHEIRYHIKNKLHKHGYKSHRISYPAELLSDNTFLDLFPSFKQKKFVSQTFTALKAYTLTPEKQLVEIGKMFYVCSKHKKMTEAYIDGMSVFEKDNKSYRKKGIATALTDYAHSIFDKNDIQYVCADAKKIDKSQYIDKEFFPLKNPESTSFRLLKNYGYKIESMRFFQDNFIGVTPMKASVQDIISNDNDASKNVKIGIDDFLCTRKERERV